MPVKPAMRLAASALALTVSLAGALCATSAAAQTRPSVADRFQIGNDPIVLCSAQIDRTDKAASGVFDRAYALVCRDARVAVGRLYALRAADDGAAERLAASRSSRAACGEARVEQVADLGAVTVRDCRREDLGLDAVSYEVRRGRTIFAVDGLKGYDAALKIALRTAALDRQIAESIPVSTAGAEDPAAFARTIATTLDPFANRNQAYRSNAGGRYFEANEYFAGVRSRIAGTGLSPEEITLNEALQQSNLGNYAAADRLFAATQAIDSDVFYGRLRRNYLALHLLNQGQRDAALAESQRAIAPGALVADDVVVIDEWTAHRLDSENPFLQTLSQTEPPPLTRAERIAVLDAQAAQIAGTALRLQGKGADSEARIAPALASLERMRGGRVTSVYWLRAQMLSELAANDEAAGNIGGAEARLRQAVRLMQSEHPQTNAEWVSRLRLAGLLARRGDQNEAYALFRETVHQAADSGETDALRSGLGPYFDLLEKRAATDPTAIDEYFFASQTLVRLGVARSQFEFARILASGSDETAAMYRTSTQVSRDINRYRLELARRQNAAGEGATVEGGAELATAIARLEEQQTQIQAKLNSSPRYQVTAASPLSVAQLQSVLGADEAYYKVFFVDGAANGLLVRKDSARIVPLTVSEAGVTGSVSKLRDSIRKEVNGKTYVMPFDVETAHALYGSLIVPMAADLSGVGRLIVEPDGALLSLPLSLLIAERGGVDSYLARARDPAGDPYDFRGISWFGRQVATSTTVSPRTLYLYRTTRPQSASKQYIGFGENAPPRIERATASPDGQSLCTLPELAWEKPISSTELRLASSEIGGETQILTGQQFTDTAIKQMDGLGDYRVLHFATHGIVTPPGRECLPQPALLTSFGGPESDGLLSFQEIFSLPINADIVLLSACDTAAGASEEATRMTGELSGGGFALDGLVRSFLGAGARAVIASHWPVPEKPIDATSELIGRLFGAQPGEAVAQSLRESQLVMMDKPATSHPYYWAAFAIIGDGAQPLVENSRTASRDGSSQVALGALGE